MKRATQLSLVEGLARPVGPLVPSVITGTNADLVAAVAPMYLTGSVLDVTYGRGKWWDRFTPDPFTAHDLKLDGVDFRNLPHDDASFDAVVFDPPYVPRQGPKVASRPKDQSFRSRYGLDTPRGNAELRRLIDEGLAECARVSRRWVLAKCTDYVNGKVFHLGHVSVIEKAKSLGLRAHDLVIHHSGAMPGSGWSTYEQLRTRRSHSYLVVLRKPRSRRS